MSKLFPAIASMFLLGTAWAGELVLNGGFESHGGSASHIFANWTHASQTAGNGGFFPQSGAKGPLTRYAVPSPPTGSYAAMADQTSPGGYVLYQDVALPYGSPLYFRAKVFVLNQAQDFYLPAPATLSHQTQPNQQARIDIIKTSADVYDTGSGVLMAIFATEAGNTEGFGYQHVGADLTALAGMTVRIRLAEVDNRQGLLFGVDDVSIMTVTLPGQPTIQSIKPGEGFMSVSFLPPVQDGGADLTYTATCIGGGFAHTANGTSSPINVGGLTNGVLYACSVRASNIAGNGSSSATLNRRLSQPNIAPLMLLLDD